MLTYVAAVLLVAVGVAAMVFGEGDDSPGLQGIGLLMIVGAVLLAVRTARSAHRG
ncbi:hypothetical protein [Blastococcus sp. TF02A-30]|uniref:hypothetical protein n=1 Tax=Blastococcus sp. TF02A-30 TaxID=2250580 RepID=UPI0018F5A24A|nr:hypothetical protein [Blastococcus sp. TF02A-30]